MIEAVEDVPNGSVITLPDDTKSVGIKTKAGQNITIDLNGHELDMVDKMTGSPCYETNGFQFLAGSTVTIKNGTIRSDIAKILVQNYSNLTLDNVTFEGTDANQYMLSCNFGNIVLKNGTAIKPTGDHVAFDAYYGMSAKYDSGVTVSVADDSVIIKGRIEFAKADRVDDQAFRENAHIYIPVGYTLAAPAGFKWEFVNDGRQELVPAV